jgi:hypothetical protein
MAFEYKDEIKNILLSMSLSERFPAGAWVGYGFQMRYSGSTTGSVSGAITMWDENILSTGTASLQIYIPSPSYLDSPSKVSASLASLVSEYTNFTWSGSDYNKISTQIIYAPGEINPYACSTTCYRGENPWVWNNILNPATVQNPVNRNTTRPVKGGLSISSTVKLPPYGPGGVGTMGLVCQDSASGALVGLTNNHVVIRDPFYTSQQNTSGVIENEYDLVDSSNAVQVNYVYQHGETIFPTPGGVLEIGRVLRYVPLYTSASTMANNALVNNSDAAIFSLYCTASGGATIINFTSSFQQVGLSYTSSMPFASTAEINNLMNTNPELYSSGRTTGAKGSPGTLCPLRIWSFVNSNVYYNLQGTSTPAYMQDLIAFVKPDNSASYAPSGSGAPAAVCPYPGWPGDSGSTLIANIGGVWKIVGLVFAGNGMPYNPPVTGVNYEIASSMGLACRIDHVASQLGIKAWTGSAAPVIDPNSITYVTVSGSNSTKIYNCSGSSYWQVGLTERHNFC